MLHCSVRGNAFGFHAHLCDDGHKKFRQPHSQTKVDPMVSRLTLVAMLGTLALVGQAHASEPLQLPAVELSPLNAHVTSLGGGSSAVTYYTYDPEGAYVIRVVTTVGSDPAGSAPPVRFVNYLAAGQKAELSVAGADGEAPVMLELAYDSDRDRLVVRSAPAKPQV